MKPWERIVRTRLAVPLPPNLLEALDPDTDTRSAFDDLRRSLAADLERETGSGMLVRASLELLLGAFIERARQRRGEIGLVALELEGWKAHHESAGAAAFESACASLGQELRGRVRASDDVGWLGEAQLTAILPGCEEQSLQSVSERLRMSLESVELSLGATRVRPSFVAASIAAPMGPGTTPARVLEDLACALEQAREAAAG